MSTNPSKEYPTKEITGGFDTIIITREHRWKTKEDKLSDSYSYKSIIGTEYKCDSCDSIVDDCYIVCPNCKAKDSITYVDIEKEIFIPAKYSVFEYCIDCGGIQNLTIVERDE